MEKSLNKVEVSLSVAGQPCFVIHLTLRQGFNCHHTFEATVDYEELDEKWMESPEKIIKFIGQDARIEMKHRDGSGENLFNGVITNVAFVGHHGTQNQIKISGCSPTIKLDGSKTMDSFMDKNLSAIVSEAVGNSGNGGNVTASPKFSGGIDFICQYEETAFEFLNRLSRIYSEWFFYDGITCYFGKPGTGKVENVTFEADITQMSLSANMIPSKMKRYHYLVHDDKGIDMDAPDSVQGVSGYHEVSKSMSSSIYTSGAVLPAEAAVKTDRELEDLARAEKTRAVAGMLTLSGESQTSKVKIGKTVAVRLPESMQTTKKEVGEFLVIEVTHEYSAKGEYRNTFTAIPSRMDNIPMSQVYFPKAYPQIATVKSNEDEKKLGRVKVEFQWQKAKGKTTNWIRVQTPDAGKSDEAPKNRGIVFIPEKDDIVMIGFEYGDPNRPFVAGSIFSEKVSAGGKDKNKIKSITTRMGSKIEFDEEKGSITVKDKNGSDSTIVLHGDKTISITAADKITLTAREIIINGSDLVHTLSDKMIKEESKQNIESRAVQNVTIEGTDKVSVGSSAEIRESAPEIYLTGEKQVEVSGRQVDITGTAKTNVKGMPVNLN
jgi:uncharacterized protein involved in type VI secretion and phage assembly